MITARQAQNNSKKNPKTEILESLEALTARVRQNV